jgi:hypothetical protein
MEESFICPDSCCKIKICPYIVKKDNLETFQRKKKAGVFIYDPSTNKVLLIQSRGNLWGPPKGTINYGETDIECAIREVKEETGITIYKDDLFKAVTIFNKATYFYLEMNECDVFVQNHIPENDANGIGWIKNTCLEKCIENGNITLSHHCRIIFKEFLSKDLPKFYQKT